MGEPGVEPGCPFGQGILSPQRLPFRHSPKHVHSPDWRMLSECDFSCNCSWKRRRPISACWRGQTNALDGDRGRSRWNRVGPPGTMANSGAGNGKSWLLGLVPAMRPIRRRTARADSISGIMRDPGEQRGARHLHNRIERQQQQGHSEDTARRSSINRSSCVTCRESTPRSRPTIGAGTAKASRASISRLQGFRRDRPRWHGDETAARHGIDCSHFDDQ